MTDQLDFVHLHVHTEYSLLDGLSKIDKLVNRAVQLGMKSLAITDHGAMFGVIQFWRACDKAGIKPIIGMEGYLARQSMHIHDQSERQPFHLLLLAKDMTGYKNLLQIASVSQFDGFYGKPRIDKDFLAAHSEGIICTSGCLAAEIPRLIVDGREDEAKQMIGTYLDIFGKENFYLELQDHDIPEIKVLNDWLIANRDYADIKMLATNDVHYVLEEDFNAHDTLLCIQTNAKVTDQKRMRMTDPSYHLRSQIEMWNVFGHIRDGEPLKTSLEIADMCNVNLNSKGYHLPVFPVPEGYTPETYLRYLAERGLRWRYGAQADNELYKGRLNYELSVIHQMGFDTYFLIVWDLCQYARKADIWWNVRGSGAGSVTAYCLGITNIDPIKNNLIFERFLNPGRVSMPDIDMDFPDDRRMDMIDYAMRKYGSDKVAAIITFGTMKARAAIKDVGRALGYSLPEVMSLTKLVPQIPSKPVTLSDCLSDNPDKAVPELRQLYDNDERIHKLLDAAQELEGVTRNAGTHAAGVIIGDKPLVEYLPLHRPLGETKISQITQFPMEVCESIGLLKVDFLGLSTLTIMRKACDLIERYHGIKYTMANIPYLQREDDDEYNAKLDQAFDLIGEGETTGIFQLEGAGMTRMLVEMKPRTFEHIIAAISLYRPGPMELIPTYIKRMHGEEEVTYHHPKLEPILNESYGIAVYQEQLQQIAAQLFGYSLADADLMRRAVSKKKAKDLALHKQTFMEQGPQNGIPADIAEKIFAEIEYFAAYGFNKSHAADYAVLTCQTAYLKAHYPEEYYTALLSVQRDVINDVKLYISDCRHFNIPVLPPDINSSELDFTIEPTGKGNQRGIRYGLGAVKNAGEKAVEHIIEERQRGGRFSDLTDFLCRVDLRKVGKKPLESLVKVGALDSLAPDRSVAVLSIERMHSFSGEHHRRLESGQMSLFEGIEQFVLEKVTPDKEISQRDILRWEKELIGLYVSEHPLTAVMDSIQHLANIQYSEHLKRNSDKFHDKGVTVAGLVGEIRTLTTKKNDQMAIVTIEDVEGLINVTLFPRTWAQYQSLIQEDKVIIVRGKCDNSRGDVQVIAESLSQDLEIVRPAEDAPAVQDESVNSEWPEMNAINYDDAPDWAVDRPETSQAVHSNGADAESEGVADEIEEAIDETYVEATAEPIEEPVYETVAVTANGHVTEQVSVGRSEHVAYDYDIPESPCLITITVVRTDDPDKDRRKLMRLQEQLISYPGSDYFRFRLVGLEKTIVVEFPEHSTSYAEVAAFLHDSIGANAIQIEPLETDS